MRCDVERKYVSGMFSWRISSFIALVIRLSPWINWATSKTGQRTCLLFYLWSCVIIPCGFSHDLRQPIGISTSVFNSAKAASVPALLADRFAIHQPARPAPLRAAWQRRRRGEKVWWGGDSLTGPERSSSSSYSSVPTSHWLEKRSTPLSPRSHTNKTMHHRRLSAHALPLTRCWSKDQGRR